MSLKPPPTVENFYKFCGDRKLMGVKCSRCGKVTAPPRSLCMHCGSTNLAWTEILGRGILVTYTIIHIAPAQFQSLAPYAVGVVEFPDRVRLPGMIHKVSFENLKVGMELAADFETAVPSEWPRWPRYFFREP